MAQHGRTWTMKGMFIQQTCMSFDTPQARLLVGPDATQRALVYMHYFKRQHYKAQACCIYSSDKQCAEKSGILLDAFVS